jgi:hypothetical protein
MTVIIQDLITEAEAVPRPAQPHDPGPATGEAPTMERLRAAMLRDAQRQARRWAD